jgi:hypothetical protein
MKVRMRTVPLFTSVKGDSSKNRASGTGSSLGTRCYSPFRLPSWATSWATPSTALTGSFMPLLPNLSDFIR